MKKHFVRVTARDGAKLTVEACPPPCRKAPPKLPGDASKPGLLRSAGPGALGGTLGRPGSQERPAARSVVLFEEGARSDEEDHDIQVGGAGGAHHVLIVVGYVAWCNFVLALEASCW